MSNEKSDKRVIVSVYPLPLQAERPWGPTRDCGVYRYRIEAAQPNRPATLVVEGAWQKIYLGDDRYMDSFISADEVARDLVTAWTRGRIGSEGDANIGVFVAKGDKPTPEEIAEAEARQEAYFNNLFEMAEAAYKAGRPGDISDEMRKAAEWLGREEAEWAKPFVRIRHKSCMFCFSDIPEQATVCRFCGREQTKGANK